MVQRLLSTCAHRWPTLRQILPEEGATFAFPLPLHCCALDRTSSENNHATNEALFTGCLT